MTRVENYLDALVNMEEGPDYPKVTRTRVENYLDAICKNAGRRKVMPTAGPKYRGKIIQYVGETNETYTKGYFYVCNGESEYTSEVTFASNKISCPGVKFLAFIKGIAPNDFDKIVKGSMVYVEDANIFKFTGKDKTGNTVAYYQQYVDDFISDGFVLSGTFSDGETIGFTCTVEEESGTYEWSQINVQPGGGDGGAGKVFSIATTKSNINSSDTDDYKTLCDFFLSVCKGEGPVLSIYLDKDSESFLVKSKYGILSAKDITLQNNYYVIRVQGISSTPHSSSDDYYGCLYSQYAAYSYLVDGGSNHAFYISKAEVDNGEVTHIYSIDSSHLATNIHFYGYDDKILKASMDGYPLGIGNTTAYTPTGNYNPATKKYVDDAVGNIDTLLANLISGGGAE